MQRKKLIFCRYKYTIIILAFLLKKKKNGTYLGAIYQLEYNAILSS